MVEGSVLPSSSPVVFWSRGACSPRTPTGSGEEADASRHCPRVISPAHGARRTIAHTVTNALFYGDNLDVLRRHVEDASVDLVYLDPPFQSGKDYSLIFETRASAPAAPSFARAHATAFRDTWRWGREAEVSFAEALDAKGPVATTMRALRT